MRAKVQNSSGSEQGVPNLPLPIGAEVSGSFASPTTLNAGRDAAVAAGWWRTLAYSLVSHLGLHPRLLWVCRMVGEETSLVVVSGNSSIDRCVEFLRLLSQDVQERYTYALICV